MAINKIINRTSKSHGGMRNCIEYVLREQKIKDGYVTMTGPAPENINWDTVYNAFIDEKRLWNKDGGRLYAHNILSFHKDEDITPEQAFDIAKEVVAETFPEHQTLISVHQDKDHIHAHLVTNTVSFTDGHKLHMTKYDLENLKQLTNQLCIDNGLTIAHKGEHFDGSKIGESEVISWNKDKYHALIKKLNIVLVDCVTAVLSAKTDAISKEDFISRLAKKGWETIWNDNRKHITFVNSEGNKIRDSNITHNYGVDIDKESLILAFERNASLSLSQSKMEELRKDYCQMKDIETNMVMRIEALEQYINAYTVEDEIKQAAEVKVMALKKDLAEIQKSIESLKNVLKSFGDKYNLGMYHNKDGQSITGTKFSF